MKCEGSSLAWVHFRYEGGTWQTVKSYHPPLSVELISETANQGQCVGVHYEITVYQKYSFWYGGSSEAISYLYVYGPITQLVFEKYYIPTEYAWFGHWKASGYSSSGNPYTHTGPGTRLPPNGSDPNGNAEEKILMIRRMDNQPDNCGESKCTFKVNDQSGTIYQKTSQICPEYRIQCDDECPPGFHKCGDCCIDCASIKSELASIKNSIHRHSQR